MTLLQLFTYVGIYVVLILTHIWFMTRFIPSTSDVTFFWVIRHSINIWWLIGAISNQLKIQNYRINFVCCSKYIFNWKKMSTLLNNSLLSLVFIEFFLQILKDNVPLSPRSKKIVKESPVGRVISSSSPAECSHNPLYSLLK